jgi:ACR3 family arsenite transporter
VMLPLALALPGGWSAAAVVIVMQSLVELFGMSVFLRWVPEHLIPDKLADRKV